MRRPTVTEQKQRRRDEYMAKAEGNMDQVRVGLEAMAHGALWLKWLIGATTNSGRMPQAIYKQIGRLHYGGGMQHVGVLPSRI